MMRLHKYLIMLLVFFLAAGVAGPAGLNLAAAHPVAAGGSSLAVPEVEDDTAAFLIKTVPEPQLGSAGGEWTIIGLARSGSAVPAGYFDGYYKRIENQVISQNGVLHDKKYTEYSRLVLALTAIGRDPANVGGYNLLQPLGDFQKTTWQGINGAIFALLALDSAGYEVPQCPGATVQATRDMYIADILERQLPGGGFALSGSQAEADVTAMALQALARYEERPEVKAAIDKSLACLSAMQNSQGGYESWGEANLESTAQVLMALCELGIGIDDARFVKEGHSLIDNMLGFYTAGQGFRHTGNGNGVGGMTTEQALCALAAWQRFSQGQSSLYDMTDTGISATSTGPADIPDTGDSATPGDSTATSDNSTTGLPGRNPDVAVPPALINAVSFADVGDSPHRPAIEALAGRGIINGISADCFAPDQTMTRAEFAAIVTRGLGLHPSSGSTFADVASDRWYAPYVGAAYAYGIVGGTSADAFSPELTITRQEAAVMVTRAAALCGLNTSLEENAVSQQLSLFDDYTAVSPWARSSLAFCYQHEILPGEAMEIEPAEPVTRGEIADMLFRMLDAANLL